MSGTTPPVPATTLHGAEGVSLYSKRAGATLPTVKIAQRSKDLAALERLRNLPRDLMGGTAAMQAQGGLYLPKQKGESKGEFERRLFSSFLAPFFKQAINGLVGMVFAEDIELGEDVPPEFRGSDDASRRDGWAENIDLAGNNLTVFARGFFRDLLVDGDGAIMVDAPRPILAPTGEPAQISQSEARQAGVRLKWVHIPASAILRAPYEFRDGRRRLREFAYVEMIDDVQHIRKWFAGVDGAPARWELWRENDKKSDYERIEEGASSIADIPVARKPLEDGEPPLGHLAEVCLEHYQLSSDLHNWMHAALGPALFGSGLTPQEAEGVVEVGPLRFLCASVPGATLGWINADPSSFKVGQDRQRALEERIAELASRPLTQAIDPTATQVRADKAEAHSTLKAWAMCFKDVLEQALAITAQFMGWPTGGSVMVNTEFGAEQIDQVKVQALQGLRTADASGKPAISRKALLKAMIEACVLPDGFDLEADAEQIEEEMRETGGGSGNLGRQRAALRRVAELVAGGMEPDEAVQVAEEEADGAEPKVRTA